MGSSDAREEPSPRVLGVERFKNKRSGDGGTQAFGVREAKRKAWSWWIQRDQVSGWVRASCKADPSS
jgi:hypothetical protein